MGDVSVLIEHFSYLAIVMVLVVAGLGVPVPEEIVLLTSGLLSSHGTLEFWKALAACWAGIVVGDSIIYLVGSRLGLRALEHPWFRRLFTPRLTGWVERHFKRHGVLTVAAARHLAGVRAPTFLVAGMTRLAYWKFALTDALSALVTVPLMVWLGFRFGDMLPKLLGRIRQVHHWVAVALVAAGVIFAVAVVLRRRARERHGELAHVAAEIEHELLGRAEQLKQSQGASRRA